MQGSGCEAGSLHLIDIEAAAKEFPPVWVCGASREKIREVVAQGG
jgi:hypothetical protein